MNISLVPWIAGIICQMKNKYLIDTNIIIYYFNGLTNDEFVHTVLKESFNISIVTKIEFLSWKKLHKNHLLKQQAEEFITGAMVYELDDAIADETIRSRQKFNIKTPDAIIGATAVVNGFDMVTNNSDDFEKLKLKIRKVTLSKPK